MLRSTFSTTTMASSTTMPMASTRPNSVSMLSEKPKASSTAKRADQRDGNGDDRDDRRAPGLQEDDDDDDDQHDRLEDRLVDLVDRFGDELGRVVDDLVGRGPAGNRPTAPSSSSGSPRPRPSALVPGRWKMPSATAGLPLR